MKDNTRKQPVHQPPIWKDGRSPLIFLTVCTKFKQQVLHNDFAFELLCRLWKESPLWLVGKFVVMPDHLHLFCAPTGYSSKLEPWVQTWKSKFTKEFKRQPQNRDIIGPWQKNFWDTQMRSEQHYAAQWEYIQNNPLKRGWYNWKYQGEINPIGF